jgi:hypothetical protein
VALCCRHQDHNRLTLDRTKEQLQQMAAYQLENPNTGAPQESETGQMISGL